MIFLPLLVLFCYFIHKKCAEKGISPWGYLSGFIAGFFLVMIITSVVVVLVYGQAIISDPQMEKKVLAFVPLSLIMHLALFFFFNRKISRIPDYDEEEDDTPPTEEKKDLSYFR